jgi:hypothetical protein
MTVTLYTIAEDSVICYGTARTLLIDLIAE